MNFETLVRDMIALRKEYREKYGVEKSTHKAMQLRFAEPSKTNTSCLTASVSALQGAILTLMIL